MTNLKRFVFYLIQAHTEAVFDGKAKLQDAAPEVLLRNAEGGGSVAIARAGCDNIGGLDDSFIVWCGEDSELWERARTLRVWPWGNLCRCISGTPRSSESKIPGITRRGITAQLPRYHPPSAFVGSLPDPEDK